MTKMLYLDMTVHYFEVKAAKNLMKSFLTVFLIFPDFYRF